MMVALKLSAPILVTSLVVGFTVSLFQSVTQIQELTLSFVPKLVGVGIALLVSGNWMLHELVASPVSLFEGLPRCWGRRSEGPPLAGDHADRYLLATVRIVAWLASSRRSPTQGRAEHGQGGALARARRSGWGPRWPATSAEPDGARSGHGGDPGGDRCRAGVRDLGLPHGGPGPAT